MARPNKPWFREFTGWWVVKIGGVEQKLARGYENKAEAERKFHELKGTLAFPAESPNARVLDVVEAFLGWASTHVKAATFGQYQWYGQRLCDMLGRTRARRLRISRDQSGPRPARASARCATSRGSRCSWSSRRSSC